MSDKDFKVDVSSNGWSLDQDDIDNEDFDISSSGWKEGVEGLKNAFGTLGGFYPPTNTEVLYWDSEYLILKRDMKGKKEPIFSLNKWTGEKLEGVKIDELPKDAQGIILKEKI